MSNTVDNYQNIAYNTHNATVVKSVDTSDLKSDSVMECQFDSGQSHHQL